MEILFSTTDAVHGDEQKCKRGGELWHSTLQQGEPKASKLYGMQTGRLQLKPFLLWLTPIMDDFSWSQPFHLWKRFLAELSCCLQAGSLPWRQEIWERIHHSSTEAANIFCLTTVSPTLCIGSVWALSLHSENKWKMRLCETGINLHMLRKLWGLSAWCTVVPLSGQQASPLLFPS